MDWFISSRRTTNHASKVEKGRRVVGLVKTRKYAWTRHKVALTLALALALGLALALDNDMDLDLDLDFALTLDFARALVLALDFALARHSFIRAVCRCLIAHRRLLVRVGQWHHFVGRKGYPIPCAISNPHRCLAKVACWLQGRLARERQQAPCHCCGVHVPRCQDREEQEGWMVVRGGLLAANRARHVYLRTSLWQGRRQSLQVRR